MVRSAVLISLFFPLYLTCANTITSLLGVPFGEICTVQAEFIDKPNDYYAQNFSQAEFYLKITKVNGKLLPQPLVMEPVYQDIKVKKTTEYTLKAYEILETDGEPHGWTGHIKQFNYCIRHKLAIKI